MPGGRTPRQPRKPQTACAKAADYRFTFSLPAPNTDLVGDVRRQTVHYGLPHLLIDGVLRMLEWFPRLDRLGLLSRARKSGKGSCAVQCIASHRVHGNELHRRFDSFDTMRCGVPNAHSAPILLILAEVLPVQ